MNADQRLDQLEPLMAETMAILDRHTAQLKTLQRGVTVLNETVITLKEAVVQQSDNISFLLREQAEMKSDVAELKSDVAEMKSDVAEMKISVASLDGRMAVIETGFVGLDNKLDLVLQLLQKPGK